MSDRPRVGISACLLGERVRYDGGDKRCPLLLDALGPFVELVPFCPEVDAGFGVPREPIYLVSRPPREGKAVPAVKVRTDSGIDVTTPLAGTAASLARRAVEMRLAGFALKARSPSCGIESVPVLEETGAHLATGSGIFASALQAALPALPVEDEVQLADPQALASFLERVLDYQRDLSQTATSSSPSSPPTGPR